MPEEIIDQLKHYLASHVVLMATMKGGFREDLEYQCFEDFVYKKGREYKGEKLKGYKRRKAKECFKNATDLALAKGLTYIEGWAVRPSLGLPIHHAWNTEDGLTVIDTTWEDPEECYYFGVPFQTEFVADTILACEVYGLFHNTTAECIKILRGEADQYIKDE